MPLCSGAWSVQRGIGQSPALLPSLQAGALWIGRRHGLQKQNLPVTESILEKFFNFPSLGFFICINGDINIFCLRLVMWITPFCKKRKFMFIFIFSIFFPILFPFSSLGNTEASPVLCSRSLRCCDVYALLYLKYMILGFLLAAAFSSVPPSHLWEDGGHSIVRTFVYRTSHGEFAFCFTMCYRVSQSLHHWHLGTDNCYMGCFVPV